MLRNVLIFAAGLTSAVAIADGRPVSGDPRVKQGLAAISQELLSEWNLVRESGAFFEIASKPRPSDLVEGYCVRDVIRFSRDEVGHVELLQEQLNRVGSDEEKSNYQIYLLKEPGKSCTEMAAARFFEVSTFGRKYPTREELRTLKAILEKLWLRPSSGYKMRFDDDIAKACLQAKKPLRVEKMFEIQSITEIGDYSTFKVRLGGCVHDKSEYVVEIIFAKDLSPGATVGLVANAISKATLDCIARECYRD